MVRHHHRHHLGDHFTSIVTTDDDDASNEDEWQGFFRCDDLIPPLCDDDLTVTTGQVETLPGLFVTYWRYTPSAIVQEQQRLAEESRHHHFVKNANGKFPIIVINGGPGLPHDLVKPIRSLACDGREVVMYDQAGTGASQWKDNDSDSDKNDDNDNDDNNNLKYPELMTIEYYAELELPALLQALGWSEYHIVAESWGTQVAFAFATSSKMMTTTSSSSSSTTKFMNEGLKSLLLNAPIADNHKFIQYQWDPQYGSVGTMPLYLQQQLLKFNDTQDFDADEFQQLQETVLSEFNARLGVVVDCWLETEQAGISSLDYDPLTGPTDIFYPPVGTTLKGWSALPKLHLLRDKVPVQLNFGGHDMVSPLLVADTAAAIGGSAVECHELSQAAHAVLLDAPELVFPYLQDFLVRVEDFDQQNRDATNNNNNNNNNNNKVLFHSNGACPVYNDNILYNVNNNNNNNNNNVYSGYHGPHYLGHGTQNGSRMPAVMGNRILIILVLAVTSAISYVIGIKVGSRRNKKFTGRYEQVIDLPDL